jgi:hypothetical protein
MTAFAVGTSIARRKFNVVHCVVESNSKPMKALLLPLMIATVPAMATGKLFVVVHTTDAVVKNYVCSDGLNGTENGTVVRSSMASQGSFVWHAVGGTAPYTVVSGPAQGNMGGCITVMDAEGQTATGCGVVGVVKVDVPFNCETNELMPSTPTKRHSEVNKPATEAQSGPTTGPVKPVSNDPVEVTTGTTTGGVTTTKTPVRNPGPTHRHKPTSKSPNRDGTHRPTGNTIGTHTTSNGTTKPNNGNTGGSNGSSGTTSPPRQ